jgi:hypothetical protein
MFEFAFMPLALACHDSQEKFDELFSRSCIDLFLKTFFDKEMKDRVIISKWKGI